MKKNHKQEIGIIFPILIGIILIVLIGISNPKGIFSPERYTPEELNQSECSQIIQDQEHYILDLNQSKSFIIGVLNGNIANCNQENYNLKRYIVIISTIFIIFLVILFIKQIRKKRQNDRQKTRIG